MKKIDVVKKVKAGELRSNFKNFNIYGTEIDHCAFVVSHTYRYN